jgi:hypothetical protein
MQRLITLTQDFLSRRLRSLALAGLVGLMGWLMIASQPAYAAKSADASTPVDQVMTQEPRDQAYEEALEVIDDPNGVQKTYKDNLKQYRQENPENNGPVESAKDLVKKMTPGSK